MKFSNHQIHVAFFYWTNFFLTFSYKFVISPFLTKYQKMFDMSLNQNVLNERPVNWSYYWGNVKKSSLIVAHSKPLKGLFDSAKFWWIFSNYRFNFFEFLNFFKFEINFETQGKIWNWANSDLKCRSVRSARVLDPAFQFVNSQFQNLEKVAILLLKI